jgi:hypothetical protein
MIFEVGVPDPAGEGCGELPVEGILRDSSVVPM